MLKNIKKRKVVIAKGSGISHTISALNTKCYYIAKILKECRLNVTILSGIYYQEKIPAKKTGRFQGVAYYAPSVFKKTHSKIKRIVNKISHIWSVVTYLIAMRRKWGKIRYIFDDNSVLLPILILLSWLGVVELVFNIEEWPLAHELPLKKKIVPHLFTVLSFMLCGKAVCVSSFIIEKAALYNKKIKLFLLPAITDFSETKVSFQIDASDQETVRFLYCGNVGYYEVIDKIITAFIGVCELRSSMNLELVLILHGDALLISKCLSRVKNTRYSIHIKTHLTEHELYSEYYKASCLLAPLRNTQQDQSRFPQKIAEYTLLSKPIITTNVGDINKYFVSNKSALFIDNFVESDIEKKMLFVIDHMDYAAHIGLEGNLVGKQYFDYMQYVPSFGEFIM